MNPWLVGAFALVLGFIPCGIVIARASVPDRLVALEMAGILAVSILMLLAQAFQQPSFHDLALTLALLSFPAGLVVAYFIERWL